MRSRPPCTTHDNLAQALGRRGLSCSLLGWGSLLVAALCGCSLLSDFSAVQCESTAECLAKGNAFAGTECVENACITPSVGGDGGAGPVGECETNTECIEKNFNQPFLCREGECVSLKAGNDCPVVLGTGDGNAYLRSQPEPIIFGAYSYVDPAAPSFSRPTLNYELAIDEVNKATNGGLPTGPDGSLRNFVAIVCNGVTNPDLDASLAHLIDTVGVSAILAGMYAPELTTAFNKRGVKDDIFFLSPLDADSTMTGLMDKGLLWHMLPPASDLAPAFPDLVQRVEALVRAQRGMADKQPVRIAMVEADTQFYSDLGEAVLLGIKFNGGQGAFENDENFLRLVVESSRDVESPDNGDALQALTDFRPHLVLALGGGEMALLMSGLEARWKRDWADCPEEQEDSPACPPFYIAGPTLFEDVLLADMNAVHRRLLGINFAGSEDTEAYDLYLSRLEGKNPGAGISLEGSENFYDATYYMMFALAAAGKKSHPSGSDVRAGMERLIDPFATEYQAGRRPSDPLGVLVSTSSTIQLTGVMGPPDFDRTSGARRGLPSVFCLDDSSGQTRYIQDALRYDSSTGKLVGEQECVPGLPESAP